MTFNIEDDQVIDSVIDALEQAGAQASEEQFFKIVNAIDNGMPGVIAVLTNGMAEHWRAEAIKKSPWGTKYASDIKTKLSKTVGEIYLDEKEKDRESNKPKFMFSMMVEQGVKSWSIKEALLASKKAKVGADGVRYITVPFPVATPRKPGQGKMQNYFGKREMTQEIYKIVAGGGKIPRGTLLETNGVQQDIGGLSKWTTKKYHGQYGFFRRVSDRSKGWQFPGKAATPVFPSVVREVEIRVQEIVTEFCKSIVREYSGK